MFRHSDQPLGTLYFCYVFNGNGESLPVQKKIQEAIHINLSRAQKNQDPIIVFFSSCLKQVAYLTVTKLQAAN